VDIVLSTFQWGFVAKNSFKTSSYREVWVLKNKVCEFVRKINIGYIS